MFMDDSRSSPVIGKGKVLLKLTSGKVLTLNDVPHASDIHWNLVSMSVTPQSRGSVDYPSTCGKSIRLVSRDAYLSKNGHLGPYINTRQTCTQLYSNSPRVILLLLIQIHIKIYNSNTYYPKTSKPQPDFLQNRSLRRVVFSNTPVPEKMFSRQGELSPSNGITLNGLLST